MTATDEQQIKALNEAHDMSYVRQVQISGRVEWALFNADGDVVHHSENRSSAFFFAAERDFRICMRN